MPKKTVSVRTLAVVSKYIVGNGVCIAIICMFSEKYNTMAKGKNVLLHILIAKVQYVVSIARTHAENYLNNQQEELKSHYYLIEARILAFITRFSTQCLFSAGCYCVHSTGSKWLGCVFRRILVSNKQLVSIIYTICHIYHYVSTCTIYIQKMFIQYRALTVNVLRQQSAIIYFSL